MLLGSQMQNLVSIYMIEENDFILMSAKTIDLEVASILLSDYKS